MSESKIYLYTMPILHREISVSEMEVVIRLSLYG